jgi:hypothetical protein
VANRDTGSRLTDPRYCMERARRLLIPINEDNWELVGGDADDLNVLQAAIAHLVYADETRENFQELAMQIVFTAYLMGRLKTGGVEASEAGCLPAEFIELIESLDLSGLTG